MLLEEAELTMQIEFLQADAVNTTLFDLIDRYDEFHWAVAWGSATSAAKQLLKYPAKFRNVTFGVAFCQTDPQLIDYLVGVAGARVATKFKGGTYHPKVYLFRSGTRAAAVVGSANFTFGGLGKNHEAAIFVQGDVGDSFFADLLDFTAQSATFGEPITEDFAEAYRASHKRASRMPKPPQNPLDNLPSTWPTTLTSTLLSMEWADYVTEIRASKNHDVDESLRLLRVAQGWLASARSFSDLPLGQRQAIAGLVVDRMQRTGPHLDLDWGWFGSMRGMGDFAQLVIANDPHLARAIDSVPQKGDVSRQHFDTFVEHFERAFEKSARTGGYATASRLLAMKRPDTFICICNPNIKEASVRMGFAPTTLSLNDYWAKVVEVIRLSDWHNTEKPDDAEGELWEFRAAMLDAILYQP